MLVHFWKHIFPDFHIKLYTLLDFLMAIFDKKPYESHIQPTPPRRQTPSGRYWDHPLDITFCMDYF